MALERKTHETVFIYLLFFFVRVNRTKSRANRMNGHRIKGPARLIDPRPLSLSHDPLGAKFEALKLSAGECFSLALCVKERRTIERKVDTWASPRVAARLGKSHKERCPTRGLSLSLRIARKKKKNEERKC